MKVDQACPHASVPKVYTSRPHIDPLQSSEVLMWHTVGLVYRSIFRWPPETFLRRPSSASGGCNLSWFGGVASGRCAAASGFCFLSFS